VPCREVSTVKQYLDLNANQHVAFAIKYLLRVINIFIKYLMLACCFNQDYLSVVFEGFLQYFIFKIVLTL